GAVRPDADADAAGDGVRGRARSAGQRGRAHNGVPVLDGVHLPLQRHRTARRDRPLRHGGRAAGGPADRRPPRRRRAGAAGPVGLLPTGPRNAITDVPGVLVGHSQAVSGELTGVTVVAPPKLPARAGVATVNGVGELTKKLEIDEWGIIQTAVYLCGTHALGM